MYADVLAMPIANRLSTFCQEKMIKETMFSEKNRI